MRYHVHTLNYNHFLNHDSGHLGFSRWPKINSTCPIDNMKTNFKFEVDWGNGFKDIAFTSINFDSTYISKVPWRPSCFKQMAQNQ